VTPFYSRRISGNWTLGHLRRRDGMRPLQRPWLGGGAAPAHGLRALRAQPDKRAKALIHDMGETKLNTYSKPRFKTELYDFLAWDLLVSSMRLMSYK